MIRLMTKTHLIFMILILSVPNFRRHLSSAFLKKKQKNYGLERSLYVKLKDRMSHSVDPDETAHYEPSHLDLCCLQKLILLPMAVKELKSLLLLLQV